jgi:hypothetical protein
MDQPITPDRVDGPPLTALAPGQESIGMSFASSGAVRVSLGPRGECRESSSGDLVIASRGRRRPWAVRRRLRMEQGVVLTLSLLLAQLPGAWAQFAGANVAAPVAWLHSLRPLDHGSAAGHFMTLLGLDAGPVAGEIGDGRAEISRRRPGTWVALGKGACELEPLTHQRKDAPTVRRLEEAWSLAFLRGDTSLERCLLTSDFTEITRTGEVKDLAYELELAAKNLGKNRPIPRLPESTVLMHGNVAVAYGMATVNTADDRPRRTQFADYYLWENGAWWAFFAQQTPVDEPRSER